MMKRTHYFSLTAMAFAASFVAPGAMAADLGGDCCADLEERIAELEATTARKGNRKVSLTVNGWVAQQIQYWDNGEESNVYITDTGGVTVGTHFTFTGKAQIAPGWVAGYVLTIEPIANDPLTNSESNDNGTHVLGSPVALLESRWFVKSDTWGQLGVGRQSAADDNTALQGDASGTLIPANYILYDLQNYSININGALQNGGAGSVLAGGTPVTWGAIAACQLQPGVQNALAMDCNGVPNNNVRYDTPTFGGFNASVSWGEDDIWSVSARYSGVLSSFKLNLAAGYSESKDDNGAGGAAAQVRARGGQDAGYFQFGGYLQHIPTGVFGFASYGIEDNDTTGALNGLGQQHEDGDGLYVKAGIRQKWTPFGATVLFGEYQEYNDKYSSSLFDAGVVGSEFQIYGAGIVQEIDAAGISTWLVYRHYEGDISTAAGASTVGASTDANFSLDDADVLKAGMLIPF